MTTDELKQEAFNWTEKNISVGISMYNPSIEMYCAKAYEESAEPREKRIAELEAQIEKMQNCRNCKNEKIEGACGHFTQVGWCKNWELAD